MIPTALLAGFTISIPFDPGCYGPDAGWSASLLLRGPQKIDIPGVPDPADPGKFIFQATATESTAWLAGEYWYTIKVSRNPDAYQMGSGSICVQADPSGQEEFDGRSQAKKILDAIDAMINKRATLDQERYRIGNRELYRIPFGELLKFRQYYYEQWCRELRAQSGSGLFGPTIGIRFNS